DEDVGRANFAGLWIEDLDFRPGVIDEEFFAGAVRLPERNAQLSLVVLIKLGKAGVAVMPLRVLLGVLLPEQETGDAFAFELLMNVREVREDFRHWRRLPAVGKQQLS